MGSLTHQSLVEKVVSYIKEAIHLGQFKPGEKLPEVQISKQLGISRAPVREAFRILGIEGLVEAIPRKGVRVRELSIRDIESLYDLRITLDSLAVKLALSNIDKSDIATLEAILRKMRVCVQKKEFEPYQMLNVAFHNLFYERSHNKWLINISKELANHIKRLRTLSISIPGRLETSYTEHVEILEAIKESKALEVVEKMKKHMEAAGEIVSTALAKTNGSPLASTGNSQSFEQDSKTYHETTFEDFLYQPAVREPFVLQNAELEAVFVRAFRESLKKRVPKLSAMTRKCVKRFDIHEILVTNEKQKQIRAPRLMSIGFIEFMCGGVLVRGDTVQVGHEIIGEVIGFDEQNVSNYLGIVIGISCNISKLKIRYNLGNSVLFLPKKERRNSGCQE